MTDLSINSGFLPRSFRRTSAVLFLAKSRRLLKRWAEAAVILWDRRVAVAALHRLDDRVLMDIGIPRSSIEYNADLVAQSRMRKLHRA